MYAIITTLVFTGAASASIATIAIAVAPQRRRIASLVARGCGVN